MTSASDGDSLELPVGFGSSTHMRARIRLAPGARILTARGYAVVTEVGRIGATLEFSSGASELVPYEEIAGEQLGGVGPLRVLPTLEPFWSSLPEEVRTDAEAKLEVVQEVLTGYRFGHHRLALDGEPHSPFGDQSVSLHKRCEAMARQLTYERRIDRKMVRRVAAGELASHAITARTIENWIGNFDKGGLGRLVSGHAKRAKQGFDAIDERVLAAVDDVLSAFDGGASRVNTTTIEMQIKIRLKEEGLLDLIPSQRLLTELLSQKQKELGRTTRAHRARKLREASGHSSNASMHPSHSAIDATRTDNMVCDELTGKPMNVEVLTLISISTRVISGLRVVPRSANGVEAGLLLYDAMRPMSMLVEGTTVHDWRWCGIPEVLDMSGISVHRSPLRVVPPGRTLQGVHHKPGVTPTSIRCDHGSVFLSRHFLGLLDHFGIHLLLSRGSRPLDNAHVERWHETLQRAYQAIPGYKGRNVAERGLHIVHDGDPLLTARELERHLRRFVALDYHREWHQGLILPGAESYRLTPLEMWDAVQGTTGPIDVPQNPDQIYQFLKIKRLTIGHAGVEIRNLGYDAPVLDEFRSVRVGTFIPGSRKAPFHFDPHDVSQIWFRHPTTDRIHEIPWRARHLLDFPLTEVLVKRATKSIEARGGNLALKRGTAATEILNELTRLTTSGELKANRLYAERLRFERSRFDHAEAAEFRARAGEPAVEPAQTHLHPSAEAELADEVWPDYYTGA